MVLAKDLKSGMTFLNGEKLLRVMEASHHKPGKGNTIMRMKLKTYAQVQLLMTLTVLKISLNKLLLKL